MVLAIDEVERFLAQTYAVSALEVLGSGEWSTAFVFQCEGRPLVARFGEHPKDFRKDRRAFELYGSVLPVPRVLEIGEAFDGLAYAVSEWLAGERIDRISKRDLQACQPALLAMLDSLHLAPVPTPDGFGWWTDDGVASHRTWRQVLVSIVEDDEHPRVAGWQAFLRANAEWSRAFDRAAERLDQVAGACPDDVRSVLHGDLTAGNVLIDDCRVSAVIDWGNSLIGDPLYDVAWLVFWSPWHPGLDAAYILSESRGRYGSQIAAEPENFEERLLACYLQIGLDAMAYNAFRRTEVHLRDTIDRLDTLIREPV
jgi:hygromycin-B 4-O-kinase